MVRKKIGCVFVCDVVEESASGEPTAFGFASPAATELYT